VICFMTLLQVMNLVKSYGGVRAVDDVSFVVDKGELISLIGPNGSGKTTLIDLISGFIKPDSGKIFFMKSLINNLEPFKRATYIGRTFQVTKVFQGMTVLENLLAVVKNKQRATELLELVGLTELSAEYASNLSGGQQKLLEFARVLMLNPQLILMDEPFAGVTPSMIDRLLEVINTLNRQGVTFMIVEHNMNLALRLCRRCIVLNCGKIIADEPASLIPSNYRVIEAYLGE